MVTGRTRAANTAAHCPPAASTRWIDVLQFESEIFRTDVVKLESEIFTVESVQQKRGGPDKEVASRSRRRQCCLVIFYYLTFQLKNIISSFCRDLYYTGVSISGLSKTSGY